MLRVRDMAWGYGYSFRVWLRTVAMAVLWGYGYGVGLWHRAMVVL